MTAPEFTAVSNTGTFADVDDSVTISVLSGGGSVSQVGSTSGTWSWSGTTADEASPYTVTIKALNVDGSSSTISFTVNSTDVAPTFVSQAHNTITTAQNVAATNSGVFADVDDALTIVASQGTLIDNHNGTWSWSQLGVPANNGTVTITATNADGKSANTTFAVTFLETGVAVSGGVVTVGDFGPGVNNAFTVSIVGGNLRIHDANNPIAAGAGSTQVDPNTVDVPLAGLTGLVISADGGDDSLDLDFAGGNPILSGGVSFDGGAGLHDGLSLTNVGAAFPTHTYNYTNAHDGSIVLNNGTTNFTVNYANLKPISNDGTATDIIFNLPAGPSSAVLEDDGTSGNTFSRLRSSNASFETTDFVNPTGSLTINRGNVADTLTINAVPDFDASLTVGSLANPLNAITIAGNVTTIGNQTYNGPVNLVGTRTLTATGASSDIKFNGTVDATTAGVDELTLVALDQIVFSGNVGSTKRLGSLTASFLNAQIFLGGNISTDRSGGKSGAVDLGHSGGIVLTNSVTIDSEDGNANGGDVALTFTPVSADVSGRDLSINTSTGAGFIGGQILLGNFLNAGGAYVNDLTLDAGGGAGVGLISAYSSSINLDESGNDTGDFQVVHGNFIVSAVVLLLDTEQGNNGSAGQVDFGPDAFGGGSFEMLSLSVNTSTTAPSKQAGNVTFSNADILGKHLLNLTVTAIGPVAANDGTVTFNDAVTLASTGNLLVNSGAVSLPNAASDLTTSGGGSVTINSSAGIAFGSGASINSGVGNTTLAAGGAITTDAVGTDITATNASLSAGAAGIGTLSNPLRLSVDTLVTNTNGVVDGNQFLVEADSLTIGANDLDAGTATITLASGTFLTTAAGSILSPTVVANGATLGGNGTDSGTVNVQSGGTVSPGPTTAVLNTGSVTFVAGANFNAEVNGNVVGTAYDQLNVTGTVNLGGATLNTSGTVPSVSGQTIVLINNDGSDPVVGTFAGLAEGDTVFINTHGFKISYVGGTGNDVTLTQLIQVTLVVSPLSINEDAPDLFVFTFTRDGILDVMTVNYAITGSATFVTDYTQQTAGTFNGVTGTVVFGFGQTTAIVYIDPKQDSIIEPNETVTLTLLPGSNYVPAIPNTATATIIDDDTNVSLAVSPASVFEDSGTSINYTFTRAGVLSSPLTVGFSVNGSATFGSDYTQSGAASFANGVGSVTFLANSATAVVSITPSIDSTIEPDETVVLGLSSGAGYNVVSPSVATGTILNDDVIPVPSVTVAVSPASVLEDGNANLVYTFTRTLTTDPLTVNFTIGGGATFATDYTQSGAGTFNGSTGTITFGFGQSTATITVDPQSDNIVEPDESVVLTVVAGSGYNVGGSNVATGTITNDDASVAIAVSPASVAEDGVPNLVYTFTRAGATTNVLTVNFNVGGSATFANDYSQSGASLFNGSHGNVTFAAGSSTATVTVDPTADSLVEADETVILTITGGTGYLIDPVSSVTGTILNDDIVVLPSVTVAVSPASVGEDGSANLIYTFTRTSVSDPLTINFTVGGAATFTTDYKQSGAGTFTGTTGTVTFGFGQSTAIVTVDPKADSIIEPDEDVVLTVVGGAGYNVGGSNIATGTILNDDGITPVVTVAVSPATVAEDGAANLIYTFTRVGALGGALTVDFSVGGSATFTTDYKQSGAGTFNGSAGKVTFGFGQSTATVVVDPKADALVEGDESVVLTVLSSANYNVGVGNTATGTIIDDDASVTLAVSPSSVTEDGAGNLVYTFTRTGAITSALTVKFNVGGTATFNTDYTQSGASLFNSAHGNVTFAAGMSTATVTLDPTTDGVVEPDETAILTLTSGTGYVINSPSVATGTILNDDVDIIPDVSVAVSPASVLEDGAANLIYTFTRTSVSDPLTINFNVGGSATFTADYKQSGASTFNGSAGKVIFGYGQSTAIVTIDPKADNTIESDETVVLTVASGSGYNVGGSNVATGTITNDDGVTPTITVAVSPASVLEDGSANLIYTFTRTGSLNIPVKAYFDITGLATFTTDYKQSGAATFTGTTGSISFGSGQSTAIITIDPKADSIVESDEDVVLTLQSNANYIVGLSNTATGTIVNDDSAVTVSASPISVSEDGSTNLVYTFTRTGAITNVLTVNFNVGGTATFGNDYAQSGASFFNTSHGNVTFAANSDTAMVTIDPLADTTVEPDETVILTITSSNAYTVNSPSVATGTILNDDNIVLPTINVSVSPASVAENGSTNLVYMFTRTLTIPDPLTIAFTVGGTATFVTDYTQSGASSFTGSTGTITFGFGQSTAILSIAPQSDSTPESDEDILISIFSSLAYNIGGNNSATGLILNV